MIIGDRSNPGSPGSLRCCGATPLHGKGSIAGMAAGMGHLVKTFSGGQALRLRLGRWYSFQHSPGGPRQQQAVYTGIDGGYSRRQEGTDRHGRRLSVINAIMAGTAFGRQKSRFIRRSEGGYR